MSVTIAREEISLDTSTFSKNYASNLKTQREQSHACRLGATVGIARWSVPEGCQHDNLRSEIPSCSSEHGGSQTWSVVSAIAFLLIHTQKQKSKSLTEPKSPVNEFSPPPHCAYCKQL